MNTLLESVEYIEEILGYKISEETKSELIGDKSESKELEFKGLNAIVTMTVTVPSKGHIDFLKPIKLVRFALGGKKEDGITKEFFAGPEQIEAFKGRESLEFIIDEIVNLS